MDPLIDATDPTCPFSMRSILAALKITDIGQISQLQQKASSGENQGYESDESWTLEEELGTFYSSMNDQLHAFAANPEQGTLTTPHLSRTQRRYVHATAQCLGLDHVSIGPKRRFRQVQVTKLPDATNPSSTYTSYALATGEFLATSAPAGSFNFEHPAMPPLSRTMSARTIRPESLISRPPVSYQKYWTPPGSTCISSPSLLDFDLDSTWGHSSTISQTENGRIEEQDESNLFPPAPLTSTPLFPASTPSNPPPPTSAPTPPPRRRHPRLKNAFPCPLHPRCPRVFDRASDCKKHEQSHYPATAAKFKCTKCPKKFRYPKDVRRHERGVHGLVGESEGRKRGVEGGDEEGDQGREAKRVDSGAAMGMTMMSEGELVEKELGFGRFGGGDEGMLLYLLAASNQEDLEFEEGMPEMATSRR